MGTFDNVITDNRILASSLARTTTFTSDIQNNDKARGLEVILNTSAVTSGVNEVQTLGVDATGGTYTLTFNGQTTAALAYNADASAIETALRGLSSINGANVNVAPAGPVLTITFVGTLAAQNVSAITADSTSLTGNSHTATLSTQTEGASASSIVLTVSGINPATGTAYTILTGAAVTTATTNIYRIYPGLTAAANATVSDVLPKTWIVTVTPANASSTTYSVGAVLLA